MSDKISKHIVLILVCSLLCILFIGCAQQNRFSKVEQLYDNGQKYNAAVECYLIGEKNDAFPKCFEIWGELTNRPTIASGASHSVGILTDSSVVSTIYAGETKYYDGQCDITDWTNIVAITAGEEHTIGLKPNGTVIAVGDNDDLQCDISTWSGIVSVSANGFHTVGLKGDGTVIATGRTDDGQCQVSDWSNIVAISAGYYHSVGLTSDGTVVATPYTGNADWYVGQCDVSDWANITQISAGREHTVGLKSDGTVVATGANDYGQCEVAGWKDIVYISTGWFNTVGVKADGTVVATKISRSKDFGQSDVDEWNDIVAVCASYKHTIGLKSNGTMVSTEYTGLWGDYNGQCEVGSFQNIATCSNNVLLSEENTSGRTPYTIELVGSWYCSPNNSCNDMEITLHIVQDGDSLTFRRDMVSPTGVGSSNLSYSVAITNTSSVYCEDTSATYIVRGNYLYEVFDNGRENKYTKTQ